jgi:hypothetical protein
MPRGLLVIRCRPVNACSLLPAASVPTYRYSVAREIPNSSMISRGRRGLLVPGELAPLRPEPGLAGELGYQDPVSLRARVDHAFEYRTKSRHGTRSSAAQVGGTDVTESSDGGEQSCRCSGASDLGLQKLGPECGTGSRCADPLRAEDPCTVSGVGRFPARRRRPCGLSGDRRGLCHMPPRPSIRFEGLFVFPRE